MEYKPTRAMAKLYQVVVDNYNYVHKPYSNNNIGKITSDILQTLPIK